jgi:hypothetical protein
MSGVDEGSRAIRAVLAAFEGAYIISIRAPEMRAESNASKPPAPPESREARG